MPTILALLLLLLCPAVRAQGEAPDLQVSPTISDTGTYTLSWTTPGEVTVQEATGADFSDARLLYSGPDQATVVSGRLDGTYHYRLLRDGQPWGEPVSVEVRHHSLREALIFLSAGALVFLATVVLVVHGHRRHRRQFARQDGMSS